MTLNKDSVGVMKRNLTAKQTARRDKDGDMVTLRVLHPDLADNIRARVNVGIKLQEISNTGWNSK